MIYVIESGDYFKVGFSNNPKKRISQYKTHNPDITLVATYKGDKDVEKYVHAKFRDSLYRGEWFHKFTGWEDSVDTCIENYKSSYLILESNKEKSVGVKAVEGFLRGDTNNTLRRLFNFCHPKSNFIWSGKRLLTAEDIADLLGVTTKDFRDYVLKAGGAVIVNRDIINKMDFYSIHSDFANYMRGQV